MFIATAKKKATAVTWYIINTIQNNAMKNISNNMFLIIITHIDKTTTN